MPPVPQADRQLLALHALRQRQLRTTFLHGRRRTWRDRRRIWPAVVVAAMIIAMLIAGTSVIAAFQRQQQLDSAAGGSSNRSTDLVSAVQCCSQPLGERELLRRPPWRAPSPTGSTGQCRGDRAGGKSQGDYPAGSGIAI